MNKNIHFIHKIWPIFLVLLTILITTIGSASPAHAQNAASWDTMKQRAQAWVDANVPYNQGGRRDGYRTDCSGFVSYIWQLPAGRGGGPDTTRIWQYADDISIHALQPGDAVNNKAPGNNGHMLLFAGWQDQTNGIFYAYDMNYNPDRRAVFKTLTFTDVNGNSAKIKEYPRTSGKAPFQAQRLKGYNPGGSIPPQPQPQPQMPPTTFQGNAYSKLFIDQNGQRANLKVCANNLPGNTVNVNFWRNGREWTYSQVASDHCITFWDMDGAGPVLKNTTYYSMAAINRWPDRSWPIPCYTATGGAGLCDSVRR